MSRPAPYVVGQWVRGERFYGRRELLTELFAAERRTTWVDGLRRIGKTSLLREVERAASADDGAFVPLFCDLQGVDSAAELELCVADSIAESADLLAERGVAPRGPAGGSPLAALARLVEEVDGRGRGIWLLCDEVDEAAACDAGLLRGLGELWRLALSGRSGRLLIASSARFSVLARQREALAALLAPFPAPVHLGALDDSEALDLLRQSKAPAAERPILDDATARLLLDAAGGHPMLLQMLAKRWWEAGDAETAIRRLDSEHTLEQLFAADWRLLADEERARLRSLAAGGWAGAQAQPTLDATLARLVELGLAIRGEDRLPRPASHFLGSWLRRLPTDS